MRASQGQRLCLGTRLQVAGGPHRGERGLENLTLGAGGGMLTLVKWFNRRT